MNPSRIGMHYAFAEEKDTSREALYARIQAGYRAMAVQGAYIYVDPLGIRHKIYCAKWPTHRQGRQ